jgi:hypothetical protein
MARPSSDNVPSVVRQPASSPAFLRDVVAEIGVRAETGIFQDLKTLFVFARIFTMES